MNVFITGSKVICPKCEHKTFLRVRRKWWMKLIFSCRFYRCDNCNGESLVLSGCHRVRSSDKHLQSSR